MSLTDIHTLVGRSFSMFALAVTVLGLFYYLRDRTPDGSFFGAVIIGEGLAVLQVLIGILLIVLGRAPGRPIHFLYGALVALMWPAAYSYTRDSEGTNRETIVWVLISAFLFGVSLRATGTGPG